MAILNLPPPCQVDKCEQPCQVVEKKGDNRTYMKTCRRHNYTDLPLEKERSKSNK